MNTATQAPGGLRGVHVLVMLLSFFGVVIAINIAFSVVAFRSFPGEEVQNPYLQGLHYNAILNDRRTQMALEWRASATLEHDSAGAYVDVEVRQHDGAELSGLSLEGVLMRPIDARLDQILSFAPLGAGRYRARLPQLSEGQWRLEARAHDAAGHALDFERSFTWRSTTH